MGNLGCWLNDHSKLAGQVGTVVEILAPGVYEVEFLDSEGRTVAVCELKRAELLVLKHEPALAA